MQPMVFWPHAGAWGAGVILPPCAHSFCGVELYVMKSLQKNRGFGRDQDAGGGRGAGGFGPGDQDTGGGGCACNAASRPFGDPLPSLLG